MRVLLVEDDLMIGESLSEALQDETYIVDWVKDGRQAILTLKVQPYEIILLDLGLPEIDGMGVLTAIRDAKIDTPVLIITARDDIKDRIAGLDSGADDYVVKPFELGEVFARMRVLIRRAQGKADNHLTVGNLSLDTTNKRVMMNAAPIDLTAKEFAVMELFMRRRGEILPRTLIASQIWDMNFDSDTNVVEVAIKRLRNKVDNNFTPKLIQNIRGMGYVLEVEDE